MSLAIHQHPVLAIFACVSFVALPMLYGWVWWRPAQFRRVIGKRDPCQSIALAVHAVKVVQACLLLPLIHWTGAYELSLSAWLLGGALVLAGQTLNARVYQLLGHDGVYYGARFGRHIPWVTAWPYSHIRDPQYIGCILTVLGAGVTLLPPDVSDG